MPRANWPRMPRPHPARRTRTLLSTLLYFTFLTGFPLSRASWSSSERAPPAPADAADAVRDAKLYPVLSDATDTADTTSATDASEHAGNVPASDVRAKRSSAQDWERAPKSAVPERRVKTGDTILNIRGAVRDAIGDAGAAPGPRASSRLDTFVIRPAQAHTQRKPQHDQPQPQPVQQAPKYDRELLVEAHARARIECDVSNSSDVRWYKDGELSGARAGGAAPGGEGVWREGGAVVVGRATRGDAAAWRCTYSDHNGKTVSGKPTKLLIYEPVRSVYLAVDGRRLDAGNTWVPVRDKTELEVRCVAEGGVPPPELSWRLLALEPALDHRPYLRIHHTNYSIEGVSVSHAVVTAARELHNATLQCEARQRTPARASPPAPPAPPAAPAPPAPAAPAAPAALHVMAAKLEIHVTYPPSFVISRWPGFGVSLSAGGAAALRCDVDANPPARAWWLRDDANPTSSPPPLEAGDESARGSATLRWAALRGSHAGWYRCRATWLDTEYSSIGYYLNVMWMFAQSRTDGFHKRCYLFPDDRIIRKKVASLVRRIRGSSNSILRVVAEDPRAPVLRHLMRNHFPHEMPPPEENTETVTEAESEPEEPDHQKVEVPLGGNVQLHCPKGSVGCWWRRVVGNSSESWAPAGSHHAHGVLSIKDALYQEGGEYRCVGARAPDLMRLRELKRVTLKVTGGATATALSAEPAAGGWRLECGACGRGVRVLWVRAGGTAPATLAPDLAQHCWRAVLHVAEPDEVWCVAAAGHSGAVAVFPRRTAYPSPAPARHTVRALHNKATAITSAPAVLLIAMVASRLQ